MIEWCDFVCLTKLLHVKVIISESYCLYVFSYTAAQEQGQCEGVGPRLDWDVGICTGGSDIGCQTPLEKS